MPADIAAKKDEKGRCGSSDDNGGIFVVRMCKVPGDKGGISKATDSRERDPMKGGAEQCSGKVTTSDEFGGKGSDGRLGPAADDEKQGCLKMTPSSCGSSE